MTDIEGKEMHGYRILKPIGEGKFSIVYKAERISDGTQVALKNIKVTSILDFRYAGSKTTGEVNQGN
jgi:hypothetical protein